MKKLRAKVMMMVLIAISFTAPLSSGNHDTEVTVTVIDPPALIGTTGYCSNSVQFSSSACGDFTKNNVARDCLDNNAASWHVEGQFTEGSGKVKFVVKCGGTELVTCTADQLGVPCRSSDVTAQAGELSCIHIVLSGNPDGISGNCVDPIRPDVVLVSTLEDLEESP